MCIRDSYYDLVAEREARGINDVAILRVEEMYPFPHRTLGAELKRYPRAEVMWVQEEPQNMGAWFFMDRRIEAVLADNGRKDRPVYVGRAEAASPATGYLKRHNQEQAAIIDKVLAK